MDTETTTNATDTANETTTPATRFDSDSLAARYLLGRWGVFGEVYHKPPTLKNPLDKKALKSYRGIPSGLSSFDLACDDFISAVNAYRDRLDSFISDFDSIGRDHPGASIRIGSRSYNGAALASAIRNDRAEVLNSEERVSLT